MHSHTHQAMATQFRIRMEYEEEAYVQSVAEQCFQTLDELELKLSRFVADSDISRINKMKAGDRLLLDIETWEVMKEAIRVNQWTQGAFDIGVAEHMNIFRAARQGLLNDYETSNALQKAQHEKLRSSIFLDPGSPAIHCLQEGMKFDLGGIGKGYALDKLSEVMEELEVENYTLNAGDSTLLVRNHEAVRPFWEYPIASGHELKTLRLSNTAVSASGIAHQGNHIFDPRTGNNVAVSDFERVWVGAKKASYTDALSTGFFLLPVEEIKKSVLELPEIMWMAYSKDGHIHFIGKNNLSFASP